MFKKLFLFFGLIFLVNVAFAAEAPTEFVSRVANQVIEELKNHKATLHQDKSVVYQIVDRVLIPHVDTYGMSRSALGREVWSRATPQEKDQFSKQFVRLVVKTYAGALAEYNNEQVKVLPIRGGYNGESRVKVESIITREGASTIPLNYRLILINGQWKLYDMTVEGVSLLESFRSQFASELSQGSLDQLIAKMEQHNAGKE
ncbi:MAG: ABC transporter substrate-binding protein [Proteobacteria bacterium]|nr:ABC transporter substrate-binding protein [Pseudomonadota bacterium]